MADITKELAKIRAANWGGDLRSSVADALEKVNTDEGVGSGGSSSNNAVIVYGQVYLNDQQSYPVGEIIRYSKNEMLNVINDCKVIPSLVLYHEIRESIDSPQHIDRVEYNVITTPYRVAINYDSPVNVAGFPVEEDDYIDLTQQRPEPTIFDTVVASIEFRQSNGPSMGFLILQDGTIVLLAPGENDDAVST